MNFSVLFKLIVFFWAPVSRFSFRGHWLDRIILSKQRFFETKTSSTFIQSSIRLCLLLLCFVFVSLSRKSNSSIFNSEKKNYRINKFKREIEMNENGCRDCPKSRRKKERHKTCYGHTCELLSVLDFSFSRINRILWSFFWTPLRYYFRLLFSFFRRCRTAPSAYECVIFNECHI